jgi:putative NIF3 family GTP cyclohydrolase 1 type 2
VKTVGIVSGGGGGWIVEAAGKNVDVFVTGEPKEFAQHFAKDGKVNMIVAGHYKTERFGIQALGKVLQRKFNVKTEFIDVGCDI